MSVTTENKVIVAICVVVLLALALFVASHTYIKIKFIESGYEQEMVPGKREPVWKKLK